MIRRYLGGALLLTGVLLASGCACHKCGHGSVASAPPCCPAPAPPPCCPGSPGSSFPPPPVASGYAPPVVAIPAH